MIALYLRWRARHPGKARCPECHRRGFMEWHEETETYKRGGRWCPKCGYGVHPPAEAA